MKTRLKREDRALFEAARAGLAPTEHDRARVAKALGLNLGVGAGITSAAAKAAAGSAAASPVVAAASSVVAAKWLVTIVGVVVVGVGAGGVALYQAKTAPVPSPRAAVSAPAGSAREASTPRAPGTAVRAPVVGVEPRSAAIAEAARQGSPISETARQGSPISEAARQGSPIGEAARQGSPISEAARQGSEVSSARRPVATTRPSTILSGQSETSSESNGAALATSASEPDSFARADAGATRVRVADEALLLREADAALRAGDTARATRFLDDHAVQFPHGVLAEERDVQRVLVLCAAQQVDAARAAASRFLSAYPQSLLAGRIRASCGAL